MIYYLQNPCFNGFAPTDSSGSKDLNSLRTHLRCVKVPDVLSLMYPSLHEGGGLWPPHEQFAPMDNRQTSLSEVSGTHAHYLWWLAKYYVSCMPTLLSSPTISAALVRPKTSLGSASKMSPIKAAKAVVQPNYCAPFPD